MTVPHQADAQGEEVGGAPSVEALFERALDASAQAPATVALTATITATAYWSFPPNLEIVLARAERAPTDAQARAAFEKRLNRRPIPLVLIVEAPERTLVVGPGGTPPPVIEINPRLVAEDLRQASSLDPVEVRQRLPRAFRRAQGGGGLTGLRNEGLFSTHYLRARVPRFAEWDKLTATGRAATRARNVTARLDALGYAAEERAEGIYLLRAEGRPAAAVLSYPAGRDLDVAGSGGELPVAGLLAEMEAAGTRWGILAAGEVWRLYDAEHPSRATSFVEVDAAKLAEPAYLAALFSARALGGGTDGLASRIGQGSAAYGAELGDRLRGRVYQRVVPGLAAALADAAEREGIAIEGREGLAALYDATLTLLYRLLFVLYAEARDYLPLTTSDGYRTHSLAKRLEGVIATEREGRDFDPQATDIWSDLSETFHAVSHGQVEWGVPAYNGGLFRDDAHLLAGRILARGRPTNAGLGPALQRLAVDPDSEDSGRIDYADLDIRRLGDIYEGLLQFELDRAREPLRYDSKLDAFVPAGDGAGAEVPEDGVYVRTRSGGRKASGSFYTPQFIVRHLVNEALVPALTEHLEEVARLTAAGEEERAARKLWDFRVCDPAMGSGHFLVDALDVLTGEIARHLAEHPLRPVRAVLSQLREMVSTAAGERPAQALGELRDVDLLKRIVLKRCIYGVDRNRMAVELAKLGLWLDAFVPGLPLSYLDHNLKQGNSLIGVVGDEVQRALRPERATLEGDRIAEALATATDKARRAVETVELGLRDVQAAEAAEREREAALVKVRALYDRWSAESFGLPGARERIGEDDAADAEAAARHARAHAFFHWPLELPEVFARDRPGFDVVLGNPPWDKVRFEKQQFWVSRFPGLNALSAAQRDEKIDQLRDLWPSDAEYEEMAQRASEILQGYFKENFAEQGSGHLELAKLFLERTIAVTRDSGATGLVLPRQFLVLGGWSHLRRSVLEGHNTSLLQLSNRAGWVFPGVHFSYMVALVGRRPTKQRTDSVVLRGGVDRPSRMASTDGTLRWSVRELEDQISESLALPLLPAAKDAEVFSRMVAHPRLGAASPSFGVVVVDSALDWTHKSRRSFVHTGDAPTDASFVMQSRHVSVLEMNLQPLPAKWVRGKDARALLDEKWRKSRALAGTLAPEPSSPSEAVDIFRVVYRFPARPDDSRTLIATLAPRGFLPATGYVHSAIPSRNDHTHRLALLGCLSSLTADWWTRRFVDRHVTAGVIRSLPAPPWTPEEKLEVAVKVARMVCHSGDEALRELDLGESDLVRDPVERVALKAEVEVAYTSSLGLQAEDLRWIVGSFNERGAPSDLRTAIDEALGALAAA